MHAIAALFAVFAALTLPAAAGAKSPATVEVCGPEDCSRPESRDLAARVATIQETVGPPPAAAYYRLGIVFDTGVGTSSYSTLYVPDEGLIATNAAGLLWYEPRADALSALRAATEQLEPFGTPRAWPRYISSPDSTPPAMPQADERIGILPGIAGAALVVVLAMGVRVVRRPGRPRPV